MLRINGVRYGEENVIVSVTYKIKADFGSLELAAAQAGKTLRLSASGLPEGRRKHTVDLAFGSIPRGARTEKFKPGKVAIRAWTVPALSGSGTTDGQRSPAREDTGSYQEFYLS
jgi:hypothetical protein